MLVLLLEELLEQLPLVSPRLRLGGRQVLVKLLDLFLKRLDICSTARLSFRSCLQ